MQRGKLYQLNIFSMHLVTKYMGLPNFLKIPKMDNSLGILSWDPMASEKVSGFLSLVFVSCICF